MNLNSEMKTRLDGLSDNVKSGIPVGFLEALEVIEYQRTIRASKPTFVDKLKSLFKI